MKIMNILLVPLSLIILSASIALPFASDATSVNCHLKQSELNQMYVHKKSQDEILKYWLGIEDECKASGQYQKTLGSLYLVMKKFDEAKEAFREGLIYKDEYLTTLLVGIADVEANMAMRNIERSKNALAAESKYMDIIKKYPTHNAAYVQLSTLLLDLNRFAESKNFALKANQLNENYISYRNLTIIYQNTDKNPDKAIVAANKALKMTSSLQYDHSMMLALAEAYSLKNNFSKAKETLHLLVNKLPLIKRNKTFIEALERIKKRAREFSNYQEN